MAIRMIVFGMVIVLATVASSASTGGMRSPDPTAAVTAFDFGSRIDDNGRKGK